MEITTLQYPNSCISMKGLAKTVTLQDGTVLIKKFEILQLAFIQPPNYGKQS